MKLAVLGSTGSIGVQTLDVVRQNEEMEVVALAAGTRVKEIEAQIREFHPLVVAMWTKEKADELALLVKDLDVKIVYGMDGLLEIATLPQSDILVTAIVGMIGILPTIAAIKEKKDIALANKETLVTAGHIIMPLAKEYGVRILPVDSEHSAIFQCMHGEREEQNHVSRILLTASGGPFRGYTTEQLAHVQLKDALKHPNWSMGQKITIDSASMVNKGLEVMEAKWLFDVDYDRVEVVVQPQSIIHSMVEFDDGAVMAQLGTPDMRLPILYALTYPKRVPLNGDRLDFGTLSQITFEKPDMEVFKGLKMAYKAGRIGGSMPTVFNAANEYAVAKFLANEISFLEIYEMIESSMDTHKLIENPTVEQILETQQWVEEHCLAIGK